MLLATDNISALELTLSLYPEYDCRVLITCLAMAEQFAFSACPERQQQSETCHWYSGEVKFRAGSAVSVHRAVKTANFKQGEGNPPHPDAEDCL